MPVDLVQSDLTQRDEAAEQRNRRNLLVRSLDSENLDLVRQVFQAARWTSSRSLPTACSSWVSGMVERFAFGESRLNEKLGRRARA